MSEPVIQYNIRWGKRAEMTLSLAKDYASVFLDDREVFLHDFIYLTSESGPPYIGMIVRLWENVITHSKRVSVRWLYRPADLPSHIDVDPASKEVFLAIGSGEGSEDTNDMAVVLGKCNCKVIFPPKGIDNWQPARDEIAGARHYLSRCYDPYEEEVCWNLHEAFQAMGVRSHLVSRGLDEGTRANPLKRAGEVPKVQVPVKRVKVLQFSGNRDPRAPGSLKPTGSCDAISKKNSILSRPGTISNREPLDKAENCRKALPLTQANIWKPANAESKEKLKGSEEKLFKKTITSMTWAEKLEKGFSNGKVLLLQNFDPRFSSKEIEEALMNVFPGVDLEVAVIPQKQNEHPDFVKIGQAVVVVNDASSGRHVQKTLQENCLVLSEDGRPCLVTVVQRPTRERFPGHLPIEKYWRVQSEKFKDAVSTAHCSQPNTIEYEMALQWRVLHEQHRMQWAELKKDQENELAHFRAGMKRISFV